MTTAQQQRDEARAKANRVRFGRITVKRSLRTLTYEEARQRVADLVEESPEVFKTLRVEDLLFWIPRMRDAIARPLISEAECSPYTTIGLLGDRRRALLVSALRRDYERQAA